MVTSAGEQWEARWLGDGRTGGQASLTACTVWTCSQSRRRQWSTANLATGHPTQGLRGLAVFQSELPGELDLISMLQSFTSLCCPFHPKRSVPAVEQSPPSLTGRNSGEDLGWAFFSAPPCLTSHIRSWSWETPENSTTTESPSRS